MISVFYVFISQVVYIVIKYMGIRHIVGDNLKSRLILTALSSTVWLITTSLGVSQMIKGNYWILVPYVIASLIGVILEDKIRRKI